MKIKKAKSILAKTFGLTIVPQKDFDFFYFFDVGFESRIFSSVHTFGMSYDIAMFFLDKNFKIVEILKRVPPNKLIVPSYRCRYIVELPISLVNNFCLGEICRKYINL